METLGSRIKHYRKQKGLTQRQLADAIGVKHNSVSDWENDKNKPYSDIFPLLAGALDVNASLLLGWDNPEQIKNDAQDLANKILNNPKIKDMLPKIEDLNEKEMDLLLDFIDMLSKKK